ncbi:DUF6273 domain-containing protein, partial [Lactococcus formosensis]|uniref:DUF6273 domain-containing protein n=1 Tax=Lactococcus formosensis TaxID=1281486 RepID=UPI002549DAD8
DDFGNPAYDENSAPSDFNFHLMNPGRIFTMANEQYRYLEDMGDGNHLIIRNNFIHSPSWNHLDETLSTWYGQLDSAVQAMVQPVANEFTTGEVADGDVTFTGGTRWIPDNLEGDVGSDITQIVSGGTRRAFALSLADVARLSGEGLGFPNHAQRGSTALGWWWLRTPAPDGFAWLVNANGRLNGNYVRTWSEGNAHVRPALIINPSN